MPEKFQSAYSKEVSRINSIIGKIKDFGMIHKCELMEACKITISEYNKLKPLIEYHGQKEFVLISGNIWSYDPPDEIKQTDFLKREQEAKEILKGFKDLES